MVLDESFEQYIGSLPRQVQEEISPVLKGLAQDPYFFPDSDYIAQRDVDNFVVCEHVRGWDGWVLGWCFEYWPSTSASVEKVVAFLHKRRSDELVYEVLTPKSW